MIRLSLVATASLVMMIFALHVLCQTPMGLFTGSTKSPSQALVLNVSLTQFLMLRLANVPVQVICFTKKQAAFPALITARLVVQARHVKSVTISTSLILLLNAARLFALMDSTLIQNLTHVKLAIRRAPLALMLICVRPVTISMSLILQLIYAARLFAPMVSTLSPNLIHAKIAIRRAPLALALVSVKLVLQGSTSVTHSACSVEKERRSKEMHVLTVVLGA